MQRRAITVGGLVQAVGFRPFVYNLASRLNLGGFVRNQGGSVCIEIEGDEEALNRFQIALDSGGPPLARIEQITWKSVSPKGDSQFRIAQNEVNDTAEVFISPDVATCEECVTELFDPKDRRFRFPFINCTNCGPRLTIIRGAPYGRERTTMDGFSMCDACREEYENAADRRFHAQPIACPRCGPEIRLWAQGETSIYGDEALGGFVTAIKAGRIGALKGLGGYHLICDARNEKTVTELRRRKHREEKPFAIMVGTIEAAEALCDLDAEERSLLLYRSGPIVLLRRSSRGSVSDAVAPGDKRLGIMLPYTPLHHLLLHELGDSPLVMTSGNRSDEPIAHVEPDAFERLGSVADIFLTHNRAIHVACDDSVFCVDDSNCVPIRRSRGYAPEPIRLPFSCDVSCLALSGELKSTFALSRATLAFMSHHLGDLENVQAFQQFKRSITIYEELFKISPSSIAHDQHPNYMSNRYAKQRARSDGLKLIPVQHHHGHLAACMAENMLTGPMIGVIFDGIERPDGTIPLIDDRQEHQVEVDLG